MNNIILSTLSSRFRSLFKFAVEFGSVRLGIQIATTCILVGLVMGDRRWMLVLGRVS